MFNDILLSNYYLMFFQRLCNLLNKTFIQNYLILKYTVYLNKRKKKITGFASAPEEKTKKVERYDGTLIPMSS